MCFWISLPSRNWCWNTITSFRVTFFFWQFFIIVKWRHHVTYKLKLTEHVFTTLLHYYTLLAWAFIVPEISEMPPGTETFLLGICQSNLQKCLIVTFPTRQKFTWSSQKENELTQHQIFQVKWKRLKANVRGIVMLMVGKVVNFGQQFCTVLISRPQSFNYMQIHKTVVTFTFFDFVSFTACA